MNVLAGIISYESVSLHRKHSYESNHSTNYICEYALNGSY